MSFSQSTAHSSSNPTSQTKLHAFGRIDFIFAVLKKIEADKIFDRMLTIEGHKPDIPYGILGMIFLANLICGQQPLYHIASMFKVMGYGRNLNFDFKGTFGLDFSLDKLNDDRFGHFLDRLHEVGCRKVLNEINIKAMSEYGIALSNVNYDTTTKTMWGEYDYLPQDDQSKLLITFGHNKQKRNDKKQIRAALGVSGGFIVDAEVLPGSGSDKTFNLDNLEDFVKLCDSVPSKEEKFYYIADSAAATGEIFEKAAGLGVLLITRLPDNYLLFKESYEQALGKWTSGRVWYDVKNLDTLNVRISFAKGFYKLNKNIFYRFKVPFFIKW